jgi:hypothetical protein
VGVTAKLSELSFPSLLQDDSATTAAAIKTIFDFFIFLSDFDNFAAKI